MAKKPDNQFILSADLRTKYNCTLKAALGLLLPKQQKKRWIEVPLPGFFGSLYCKTHFSDREERDIEIYEEDIERLLASKIMYIRNGSTLIICNDAEIIVFEDLLMQGVDFSERAPEKVDSKQLFNQALAVITTIQPAAEQLARKFPELAQPHIFEWFVDLLKKQISK